MWQRELMEQDTGGHGTGDVQGLCRACMGEAAYLGMPKGV